MIELPGKSAEFTWTAPTGAARVESPLVDIAFQAISRAEARFSPIVLVGNEETGLSRWVRSAGELAESQLAGENVGPSGQVITFREREFAQAVSHADTMGSVDEFRMKLACHRVVVIEYPPSVSENSLVYRELIELVDQSQQRDQLVVVVLEQSQLQVSRTPSPLLSRLAAGLQLQINEPPRRLKASLLSERLRPWMDQAQPKQIDSLLQLPIPYWSGWEHCVSQLQQELQRRGRWPDRIADLLTDDDPASLEPKAIGQQVARCCQVKWSDLKGHSRRQSLVRARSIAIYLIRELTAESFEAIGRLIGNRDHSTVIHAYRKIREQRPNDNDLERTIQQICQGLRIAVPSSESMM